MRIPEVITSFLLGLRVSHHKYWATSTCLQLSGQEGSTLGCRLQGVKVRKMWEGIKHQIFARGSW